MSDSAQPLVGALLPSHPLGLLESFRRFTAQTSRSPRGHRKAPKRFDWEAIIIGPIGAPAIASIVSEALGAPVLVIEDHTCPSALTPCLGRRNAMRCLRLLAYAHHLKRTEGVDDPLPFSHIMDRVCRAGDMGNAEATVDLLESNHSVCVHGLGHILDPFHVGLGNRVWSTKRIILAAPSGGATGPGLQSDPDDFLSIRSLPQRMTIVGDGPEACALAQAFCRFGSATSLVSETSLPLPEYDPVLVGKLFDHLKNEGVEVVVGARRLDHDGTSATAWIDALERTIVLPHDRLITVGTGSPQIPEHWLGIPGCTPTTAPVDRFDGFWRTNRPSIFICGETDGPDQLSYHALRERWHFELRYFLTNSTRMTRSIGFARSVMTFPELGGIGITEGELRRRRISYDVISLTAARAKDGDGADLRILASAGSGVVLGASLLGAKAEEELLRMAHLEMRDTGAEAAVRPWRFPHDLGRFSIETTDRHECGRYRYLPRLVVASVFATAVMGLAMLAGWMLQSRSVPVVAPPAPFAAAGAIFEQALAMSITRGGMVDAVAVRRSEPDLRRYLVSASSLDQSVYDAWEPQRKIAFWCNVANAIFLDALASSPSTHELVVPSDIGSQSNMIMGKPVTLSEIKYRILPAIRHDPRWRFAIAYSPKGIVPLERERLRAASLEQQLDTHMRSILADPRLFRIDREANVIHLSERFRSSVADCLNDHDDPTLPINDQIARSALSFLQHFMIPADGAYLRKGPYQIVWHDGVMPDSSSAVPRSGG